MVVVAVVVAAAAASSSSGNRSSNREARFRSGTHTRGGGDTAGSQVGQVRPGSSWRKGREQRLDYRHRGELERSSERDHLTMRQTALESSPRLNRIVSAAEMRLGSRSGSLGCGVEKLMQSAIHPGERASGMLNTGRVRSGAYILALFQNEVGWHPCFRFAGGGALSNNNQEPVWTNVDNTAELRCIRTMHGRIPTELDGLMVDSPRTCFFRQGRSISKTGPTTRKVTISQSSWASSSVGARAHLNTNVSSSLLPAGRSVGWSFVLSARNSHAVQGRRRHAMSIP